MKLYIDKRCVLSLMSQKNENSELFDESIRLIKKGIEVHYNFPKEDIKTDAILTAWFGKIKGQGVHFDSTFCPTDDVKPIRPVKTNFYSNYNGKDLSSLYMLDINDNIYEEINKKFSIMIAKPGEELNVFQILLDIPDERLMKQMSSWREYCPNAPITDAIICDEHYFKHKNVYEANKNELISALASISKESLFLVIVTKEDEIDKDINIEDEVTNIKNIITKYISKKKCGVTIMTTRKTHSRHIITNYYRIAPTSCVHLKDNQLKDDVNIFRNSYADPKTEDTTDSLLNVFQDIANNPVNIYGDRKSNYINFPKDKQSGTS